MDCAAATPLLAAHGDNALGAVDRAAVRTHLENCADCRDRGAGLGDRIGRLEAVLAGYRVRLAAVDAHIDAARAALGGRLSTLDLTPLWVGSVLVGPGILALIVASIGAALDAHLWWWTDAVGGAAFVLWLAGTVVPALAAVLLVVGWRRLRAEAGKTNAEGILLAITGGFAALLAWWPFVGVLVESSGRRGLYIMSRGWQSDLVFGHLALGVLALCVAVLVAAPMILRPPRRATGSEPGHEPGRRAVRGLLEDALRLLALACFERGGDLLEAARVAEDELGAVATRLKEAEDDLIALRALTTHVAGDVVAPPDGGSERATMKLRKVAERRELEAALHGLPPDARAIGYLRLVTQVPLTRVQGLLAIAPTPTAQGLSVTLATLGSYARSPSDEGAGGTRSSLG